MEQLWTVTAAVIPVLVSVGVGVISVPGAASAEFWVARGCFIGAAVWLGVLGCIWLTTTDQSVWVRSVCGVAIGAVVFLGLPNALRWVGSKQAPVPPASVSDARPAAREAVTEAAPANTRVHALAIEFGEGQPFEEVPDLASGKRMRTVRVAVRNVGNGRLVGCTLRITRIAPFPAGFEPPLRLNGRFPLGSGEREFMDVAEYVESDPSGFDNWPIQLCREPVTGAYLSGPWGSLEVRQDRREYEITLVASAPDSKDARADARLWIDDRRRLRLEKI